MGLRSSAFLLGFTAMISQILLLRELVAVFQGNEMVYALVLSSWLFWGAAGSLVISRVLSRVTLSARTAAVFHVLIVVILPLTLLAARCVRRLLPVDPAVTLGFGPMMAAAFVLLAPLSSIFGAYYAVLCRRGEEGLPSGEKTRAVGSLYLWESTGAAAGGAVFGFILVHILPALVCAGLLAGLNAGAAAVGTAWRKRPIFLSIVCAATVILLTVLMFPLERISREIQWKGQAVVATQDSRYGNITLTRLDGEYSVYQNGCFSFSTGDPLTSEENVHFPLLAHPRPRSALLIGNGLGGSIAEALRHPGLQLDYVELDDDLIGFFRRHLPKDIVRPLHDPRVRTITGDGRRWVKRSARTYDVVIVNLGDPSTLVLNRYYTVEFFQEVRRILNPGGILGFGVTSSENYLSDEARTYLRSLHSTLKSVFPSVASIPGDHHVFLAGLSEPGPDISPETLIRRLKERGIETEYINEFYLPFRLNPDRVRAVDQILSLPGRVNTDFHPVTYLYDMVLWSTQFDVFFKNLISRLSGLRLEHVLLVPLALLTAGWFVCRGPVCGVKWSIFTTGFSEIIFQLVVMMAFQSLYGYAYYQIAFILSAFMLGLVAGSWTASRRCLALDLRQGLRVYRAAQMGMVLYPLCLPLMDVFFRDSHFASVNTGLFAVLFTALPLAAGFLGGLQYPLANHLVYLSSGSPYPVGVTRPAGFLYAVDLFGAAIGALLTGAVLIPLLGIADCAYFCSALNAAVLILLGRSRNS